MFFLILSSKNRFLRMNSVFIFVKNGFRFLESIGMPYPSDTSLGASGWGKNEGFLILSGGRGLTKMGFSSIIKVL